MQNSSAFCRTQQDLHIVRAGESELANVQAVATRAAAAWGAEALSAERREERHARRQIEAIVTAEDRASSENPDRGFADRLG